jgi:hypothetical protein
MIGRTILIKMLGGCEISPFLAGFFGLTAIAPSRQ